MDGTSQTAEITDRAKLDELALKVYDRINLISCTIVNNPFMNRQDACSTRKFIFCGTGILPVLENGARCEM